MGIARIWGRLGLGATARNVTTLTLAAAVSQVVLMASQIVLAGLFDREAFGRFYVAQAAGALLAIVATGRYEMAIPLADDEAEAGALTRWCLFATTVVTILLVVIVGVAAALVGVDRIPGGLDSVVWFVPLVTWSAAAFTTLRMLQGRRERFAALGRSSVSASLVQAASQLIAGVAGWGAGGLTVGYAAGRLGGSVGLAVDARHVLARRGVALRAVARRWRRFPLFNTWPALLGGISASAVAPVVGAMYGLGFAGWFGYASYVLAAPAALLGQAVASVFFPTMARMHREGRPPAGPVGRMASALTLVAVPTFATVALLGPELFALLPTGSWREAGVIAALLAPWLAASFVSSPMSSYATVRDRLGRLLLISLAEAALRLGGLAVGVLVGDPLVGVAAYSAAGVVICLYSLGWTLRLAGSGLRAWSAGLARFLAPAAGVVVLGLLARAFAPEAVVVGVGVVGVLGLGALALPPLLRLRAAA